MVHCIFRPPAPNVRYAKTAENDVQTAQHLPTHTYQHIFYAHVHYRQILPKFMQNTIDHRNHVSAAAAAAAAFPRCPRPLETPLNPEPHLCLAARGAHATKRGGSPHGDRRQQQKPRSQINAARIHVTFARIAAAADAATAAVVPTGGLFRPRRAKTRHCHLPCKTTGDGRPARHGHHRRTLQVKSGAIYVEAKR